MRRSGRTTRIADNAIQRLFELGEINIVAANTDINNMDVRTLITDHNEHPFGKKPLYQKIKRRLMSEYDGISSFEFNDSKLNIKQIKE